MRRAARMLILCGAAVAAPALGSAHSLPGAPRCPIFPANDPWNQRVDRLPVASDSASLIASIGLDKPAHPDFGTVYDGAPNGIPFAVVGGQTKRVPVRFEYAPHPPQGERQHLRSPLPGSGRRAGAQDLRDDPRG
jgi:hypothetical protein